MRKISLILLSLLIHGCATEQFRETPYKPNGLKGGYSETHLAHNIFDVSFWANEHTTIERINDFTLLRSAELTIKNGYRHFVITDTETASAYLSNADKKPRKKISIVCFMDKPKNYDAYDAKFLLDSLKNKYNIQTPGLS